jgi:Sulfotransferase family
VSDAPSEQTATFVGPSRPVFVRMLNAVGGLLRRCGLRLTLREDRISAKASRWAGHSLRRAGLVTRREARQLEWPVGRVATPVRLLLRDIESDTELTPMGRLLARASIVAPLSTWMQVEFMRERQPEIFECPVPRPLIVIGFMRTGTTLLYSLMAQDPRARAPRLWEAMAPVPPPDPEVRKDARIKNAERLIKSLSRAAPGIETAHFVDPHGPEEDLPLLATAFFNPWYPWFHPRQYLEWYSALSEDEAVGAYEEHRAQLQILQWKVRGEHWLLKQAAHQFFLGALLRVYPDACLIQTHRDPSASIPSLCSLAAFHRSAVADTVALAEIGTVSLHAFVEASRRSIEARERVGADRFFDVAYERLVADPIGVVGEIYERFDLPFDDGFEDGMQGWLAENRQGRRGVHRYSLEQFGLDAETVNRETAFYRERFAEYLPPLRSA